MPYNNYNNNRNRNNNHRQDNNNHRQGNNAQTAVEIKAPFNFVPLPNVGPFIPGWGDQVSQDYPFEHGVSGKITLDIETMTDIFVRDSKSDSLFHNVNGKYFIPGSSIKGMLRSTLEIVTFGKLDSTRFNDSNFSYRNLGDHYYTNVLIKDIHAGWLYLHDDKYYIYVCSNNAIDVVNDRIKAAEIDSIIGKNKFNNFIHTESNFRDDANRNAKKKYEMLFNESPKEIEQRTNFFYQIKSGKHKNKYLVMTGQPGARKTSQRTGKLIGKNKEFVFPSIPPIDDKGKVAFKEGKNWIELTQKEVSTFLTINKNSANYVDFWEKVLKRGGAVPIFYKIIKENGNEVHYLGLSYMFKYPAKQTISKAIDDRWKTKEHDMADLIFGYTDNEDSLKGRVHVGHAFAKNIIKSDKSKDYALSSPKPSFYPLYLKDGKNWNSNEGVRILGRKRYPTRQHIEFQNVSGISREMISKIQPLKKGTTFQAEIIFHNLLPEELGAILYTIESLDYHQLGGLKPYGYGKVTITPTLNIKEDSELKTVDECINKFKVLFNDKYGTKWQDSATIKELQAMASGITAGNESKFKYMQMSIQGGNNEFKDAKGLGKSLQPFSNINGNNKKNK
jgi:CRISPR-associated protein (TIGR03986 family)